MADAALHSIGQRLSLSPRSQPTHTRAALEPSAQPAQSRQARQAAQPEQLLGSGMARSPDLDAAAGVPLPGATRTAQARAMFATSRLICLTDGTMKDVLLLLAGFFLSIMYCPPVISDLLMRRR